MTPRGREASKERSLAKVRDAHHSALVAAATLEEEIEWLSHPLIQTQSETQTHSCSRDHYRHRSRGQKEKALPGAARGLLCPLLQVQPSSKEFGAQGRGGSHQGSQFGRAARIGAIGHLLPPRVNQEFGRGRHEGTFPQTPNRRPKEMGNLEDPDVWNTQLLARVNHGAWGGQLWKSWHVTYRLLFNSQRGQVNYAGWRTPIRHCLHCHVFSRRASCHHQILSLPVGISGKFHVRRWWHMPGPFQF